MENRLLKELKQWIKRIVNGCVAGGIGSDERGKDERVMCHCLILRTRYYTLAPGVNEISKEVRDADFQLRLDTFMTCFLYSPIRAGHRLTTSNVRGAGR